MTSQFWIRRSLRVLAIIPVIAGITTAANETHAKAFVAGFLYLLPIVWISFRWSWLEATIASILAVGCLDYFFTQPVLQFYMADTQDWLALLGFESVVLVVSRLANQLNHQGTVNAVQRKRLEKLYEMGRAILLIDRRHEVGSQLCDLIIKNFQVQGVALWDAGEAKLSVSGDRIDKEAVRTTYCKKSFEDNSVKGAFTRTLRLGERAIGAIMIVGDVDSLLDSGSVDALSSLCAIALERSHSFMKESEAEAEKRSEQLRSSVLDGLAHAFKTPLATIQAASSGMLAMDCLDHRQEELTSLMNQEAIRLADLTSKVLRTARLDGNDMKLRYRELEAGAFVDRSILQCKKDLAGHPFKGKIGNLTYVHLWADEELLAMALAEILDNASKYATPLSPISLSVFGTESETIFSVHNEGSYIAPEERERVFDRFYRSPASKYGVPGTGIGLSVARRIIEAHHGRIWIEGDPNQGTTLFFTVPHQTRAA